MSIEVKGLTHIYSEGLPHESVALENVSFNVEDGQLVGVIGHTGSGKSTLVQHLNGLLRPKSGTIVVGDVDITADGVVMRDIRRKIGLVFQYPEYQLFEETVAKDVAFEPEILILDEPTAGLNPKAHDDILAMVRAIHEQEKNIIFLISHNMNDIAAMADKVIVMDRGQVAMDGTPAQVFSRGEELKSMGLALPDSMELVARLRRAGMDIDTSCLTMEQAADEIAKVLKR